MKNGWNVLLIILFLQILCIYDNFHNGKVDWGEKNAMQMISVPAPKCTTLRAWKIIETGYFSFLLLEPP